MVFYNKYIGKLDEKTIDLVESLVSDNRPFYEISTLIYEMNDEMDIIPGSVFDGIHLIEAAMEESKKYNLLSKYTGENKLET